MGIRTRWERGSRRAQDLRLRRIKSGVERESWKSSEFIQPVLCSAKISYNKTTLLCEPHWNLYGRNKVADGERFRVMCFVEKGYMGMRGNLAGCLWCVMNCTSGGGINKFFCMFDCERTYVWCWLVNDAFGSSCGNCSPAWPI